MCRWADENKETERETTWASKGHGRKCKILAGKCNLEDQGADGRILTL